MGGGEHVQDADGREAPATRGITGTPKRGDGTPRPLRKEKARRPTFAQPQDPGVERWMR